MKSLKATLVTLALVLGLVTPALRAETTAPAKEHAAADHAEKKLRGVDKVAEELGLNADQKAKFEAIRKEEIAALKTVKENQALDRAAKIAKNKEVRGAFDTQRRALLTPDQLAKFEAAAKAAKSADGHKDKE